jgi:hypothetical protein
MTGLFEFSEIVESMITERRPSPNLKQSIVAYIFPRPREDHRHME